MDLLAEDHADVLDGVPQESRVICAFCSHPSGRSLQPSKFTDIWQELCLSEGLYFTVPITYLCSKNRFIFYGFLFVSSYFLSQTPFAIDSAVSLSPFLTCCKLTFAIWRLNLTVLTRTDILILFQRCLQEIRGSHLSQYGTKNITSCVCSPVATFTSNHHRNRKRE